MQSDLWHASPVDDNAQSSQDLWENSTNKNEWKEVSREFHELASTLKEKISHMEQKLSRQCQKKKLAELAAQEEKQEDEERRDIKKLLKQLRKDRKHEDEARALLKQVQINLEEAQATSAATNCGVRPVRRVHAGTRTVGGQTSSWTHYGGCCRATTQRPSILTEDFGELVDMAHQAGWGRQSPRNTGLKACITKNPSHSCLGFKA